MAHHEPTKNVLRRIEDLGNSVAKDYTNIHLIARGTPLFVDQNLRGAVRFGKRSGNFLPVLAADNSTELSEDSIATTRRIVLARTVTGIEVQNSLLSIGPGSELVKVDDIDVTTGEVTTVSELIAPHEAGTPVDLFGVPIEIIGTSLEADTVIQIRSPYHVVIGDQIAIDTTKGLVNSTVSTSIIDVISLGTTVDGKFNYELTLEEGISRTLENEEEILLRAQPGYQSPSTSMSKVNGPFVIDFVSGPFFEDTVIDEFLNLQLFNSLGVALPGFESPVNVGKNFGVSAVTIKSESMLFWNVSRGSVQFKNGKFVAITDGDGRFVLSTNLVPKFTAGTEWQIPVRSNDAALLRVKFEPNEFRDFSLTKDALQRVQVGTTTAEQDATRIEIVVVSQKPNKEVEFNNWLPTESAVASIVYQITSTAFGGNIWQAGSLMAKPYFFSLDDITARYDFSAYDNGVVHF